ncbi:MAG: hypothetical protein A3B68_00765 [Candidatus Melainabacteria bacterium RIFCSPHIGHO2_02_FULL_34_12]|nr:MAG: hypothetical protein A3B68_00765 [Candidatus Melainabacteria bacterium RIFCSPHIGHO2_02_FULL_34_12]
MLQEGYFDKVYYRLWQSSKDNKPLANIFAIHGLGGHSTWFDKAAQKFNEQNINFFSLDLPGFGQSKYPRGKVESYKVWLDVTRDALEKYLKTFNVNAPVFILGHSMGALIAILLSKSVRAHGWILAVPAFEGYPDTFPLSKFILPVLCKSLVNPEEEIMVPFGPELLTKNKETQLEVKKDPFRFIKLSAEIYKHVFFLTRCAKTPPIIINGPVLMLIAGKDKVCSNEHMEIYFEKTQCENKVKKIYPDSFHDLFLEDEMPEVVSDITDWIKEHCK